MSQLCAMSNVELLECVVGQKDAQILLSNIERLTDLMCVSEASEIQKYCGISKRQTTALLAGLELGRRLLSEKASKKVQLSSPESVANYLMPLLRFKQQESFFVICLNHKHRVVYTEYISVGTLDNCLVHPREVFKLAVAHNAAAIIVAHNHPSGDPHPSCEDDGVTKQIFDAGKLLSIPLLDHLIIGDGVYYSYKEEGKI